MIFMRARQKANNGVVERRIETLLHIADKLYGQSYSINTCARDSDSKSRRMIESNQVKIALVDTCSIFKQVKRVTKSEKNSLISLWIRFSVLRVKVGC